MAKMMLESQEIVNILQKVTGKQISYDDKTKQYSMEEQVVVKLRWW